MLRIASVLAAAVRVPRSLGVAVALVGAAVGCSTIPSSAARDAGATLPVDGASLLPEAQVTDDGSVEAARADGALADGALADAGTPGDGASCPAPSTLPTCPDRLAAPGCYLDAATPPPPLTHCPVPPNPVPARVLVFTKEAGWGPHPSHCVANVAVPACGKLRGWTVASTQDPNDFNDANLAGYDVVVYLITGPFALTANGTPAAGDGFEAPRAALQKFVSAGHGLALIHSATASDANWTWYAGARGALFAGHPPYVLPGTLHLVDAGDPIVSGLPDPWTRCEELHSFTTNPKDNPELELLLTLQESCFSGDPRYPTQYFMGEHPLAWRHVYQGGRVFVTALGHTSEAYDEAAFLRHIAQGIEWAAGK